MRSTLPILSIGVKTNGIAFLRRVEGYGRSCFAARQTRLDDTVAVIHTCLTMATASVRDLRNHFPKIKKMVETQGEVIVTDKGQPKYKLTLFTPGAPGKTRHAKDYMTRLRRYQLRPISAAAAKRLHDENRGSR